MNAWVVVLAVGAASLAIRALPLMASEAIHLGPKAAAALRHAGIGAMTALLVTALVAHRGTSTHPDVAILAGVGIGAALAWRGWSMMRVVVVGAACYAAVTVAAMVV
jgi:branched-subunit amino acid transport protein